ncbi:MAG TPA: hypothetical protein VIK79_14515 [Xanthobacteraceae bacterium]
MPGTQLALGNEQPELLADLLVQRASASWLDCNGDLRRRGPTND